MLIELLVISIRVQWFVENLKLPLRKLLVAHGLLVVVRTGVYLRRVVPDRLLTGLRKLYQILGGIVVIVQLGLSSSV